MRFVSSNPRATAAPSGFLGLDADALASSGRRCPKPPSRQPRREAWPTIKGRAAVSSIRRRRRETLALRLKAVPGAEWTPALRLKPSPCLEPPWPAAVYVVAGPDPPSPAAANAKRTFTPGLGSVWPRSSLDSGSAASAVLIEWAPRFCLLRSLGCVRHLGSSVAKRLLLPRRGEGGRGSPWQPCREAPASSCRGVGEGSPEGVLALARRASPSR